VKYLLVSTLLMTACGTSSSDEADEARQEIIGANGIRANGIRANGIRANGIRANGIRANGIRANGLESDPTFSSWFNEADGGDLEGHDNFMKYVVACAARADQVVTFTDATGATHTWKGSLGLAPEWLNGPIPASQEGWFSACLLAHVNSNGKSVQISVRGTHPALATTTAEVGTLGSFAGAFFGDVFGDGGYYACSTPALRANQSQSDSVLQTMVRDQGRSCPIDGCAGTMVAVDCANACGGVPATSCTVDGKTFNQVINVYVPNYRAASGWQRSSTTQLPYETTCANCLNKQALDFWRGGSGTTAYASAVALANTAGAYSLVVRYANGSTSPVYLKVQVNNVTIKNGSSDYYDFAPTGSWDSWSTRTLSFTAASAPTVKLVGGGSAKKGPKVDVTWIQFQ
jgi:hypothetical protein